MKSINAHEKMHDCFFVVLISLSLENSLIFLIFHQHRTKNQNNPNFFVTNLTITMAVLTTTSCKATVLVSVMLTLFQLLNTSGTCACWSTTTRLLIFFCFVQWFFSPIDFIPSYKQHSNLSSSGRPIASIYIWWLLWYSNGWYVWFFDVYIRGWNVVCGWSSICY